MNQPTGGCIATPSISISDAINMLEGQQDTLKNMLDALDMKLYGNDTAKASEASNKSNGFENRLAELVSSHERALSKLERIISKL